MSAATMQPTQAELAQAYRLIVTSLDPQQRRTLDAELAEQQRIEMEREKAARQARTKATATRNVQTWIKQRERRLMDELELLQFMKDGDEDAYDMRYDLIEADDKRERELQQAYKDAGYRQRTRGDWKIANGIPNPYPATTNAVRKGGAASMPSAREARHN